MEAVFHVVDVADLEIAVDLVELLRREQQILDLGPADPLDADVELAARQRLGDVPDQLDRARYAAQSISSTMLSTFLPSM